MYNDTVSYWGTKFVGNSLTGVNVDLSAAPATATDPAGNTDTLLNIDDVQGTSKDDTLIGNDLNNILMGDEGTDTLTGNAGADTFSLGNNKWYHPNITSDANADTITDLSTRDNYKYNEYIRLLIKNENADKNILNNLNNDLDKISNIEVIFSNILYLSNFIKKERLYTLNILRMYLDDINSNYLSDNCDMSKLKEELDAAVENIKPDNVVQEVTKVIEEKPTRLSYNDALKSRIYDKINKKKLV